MTRYLLDTNIISEPFKLEPNPNVLEKLDGYGNEIAIASNTWHELLFGFHRMPKSRRQQQLESSLPNRKSPFFFLGANPSELQLSSDSAA